MGMVYSPHPPYEILQTKLIDFFTMQRLRRFARYWDLIANSGNFVETTPLLWRDGSPFQGFMRFLGLAVRADASDAFHRIGPTARTGRAVSD
jgi:hypothetical protein